MHDSFSRSESQKVSKARRVNDCFTHTNFAVPEMLFGEFWRERELALLFGAAGTGKSVLAMQMADAIARGRGVEGFSMGAKRQKVLYVDLVLSYTQFQMRYSQWATTKSLARHHEFSRNLYREYPGPKDDLLKWLRSRIEDEAYKVVIIDDINTLRQTCDGTRETLKVMREMKRLKDELGISVLMPSSSREPTRNKFVSEADMQRSRILCEVADSVFAIGRNPRSPGNFYLTQTRSRSAPISWSTDNAPLCWIVRTEDGNMIFKFDKRFVPEIDEELREMICKVKWKRDAGASYRCIADELNISKWKVGDLIKKWRPDLDSHKQDDDDYLYREEAYDFDDDYDYDDEEKEEGEEDENGEAADEVVEHLDSNDMSVSDPNRELYEVPAISAHPKRTALLSHLKRSFDKNECEIFVEKEDERGKPIVWYRYNTTGQLSRYQFRGFGSLGRHVDGPICLFNTS